MGDRGDWQINGGAKAPEATGDVCIFEVEEETGGQSPRKLVLPSQASRGSSR